MNELTYGHINLQDEFSDYFFDIVEEQIKRLTKDVDRRLNSVHREREEMKKILIQCIHSTYRENPFYSQKKKNEKNS